MGIICSCLLEPSARSTFLAAEGIELMLLIIKQKRRARTGALKALDYALVHATPACERFVDVQGLRALFPLYMSKLKVGPCAAAAAASLCLPRGCQGAMLLLLLLLLLLHSCLPLAMDM